MGTQVHQNPTYLHQYALLKYQVYNLQPNNRKYMIDYEIVKYGYRRTYRGLIIMKVYTHQKLHFDQSAAKKNTNSNDENY